MHYYINPRIRSYMNIHDYKRKYCSNDEYPDGTQVEFARRFNKLKQNVGDIFKNPERWMIVIHHDRHILVNIKGECKL